MLLSEPSDATMQVTNKSKNKKKGKGTLKK